MTTGRDLDAEAEADMVMHAVEQLATQVDVRVLALELLIQATIYFGELRKAALVPEEVISTCFGLAQEGALGVDQSAPSQPSSVELMRSTH